MVNKSKDIQNSTMPKERQSAYKKLVSILFDPNIPALPHEYLKVVPTSMKVKKVYNSLLLGGKQSQELLRLLGGYDVQDYSDDKAIELILNILERNGCERGKLAAVEKDLKEEDILQFVYDDKVIKMQDSKISLIWKIANIDNIISYINTGQNLWKDLPEEEKISQFLRGGIYVGSDLEDYNILSVFDSPKSILKANVLLEEEKDLRCLMINKSNEISKEIFNALSGNKQQVYHNIKQKIQKLCEVEKEDLQSFTDFKGQYQQKWEDNNVTSILTNILKNYDIIPLKYFSYLNDIVSFCFRNQFVTVKGKKTENIAIIKFVAHIVKKNMELEKNEVRAKVAGITIEDLQAVDKEFGNFLEQYSIYKRRKIEQKSRELTQSIEEKVRKIREKFKGRGLDLINGNITHFPYAETDIINGARQIVSTLVDGGGWKGFLGNGVMKDVESCYKILVNAHYIVEIVEGQLQTLQKINDGSLVKNYESAITRGNNILQISRGKTPLENGKRGGDSDVKAELKSVPGSKDSLPLEKVVVGKDKAAGTQQQLKFQTQEKKQDSGKKLQVSDSNSKPKDRKGKKEAKATVEKEMEGKGEKQPLLPVMTGDRDEVVNESAEQEVNSVNGDLLKQLEEMKRQLEIAKVNETKVMAEKAHMELENSRLRSENSELKRKEHNQRKRINDLMEQLNRANAQAVDMLKKSQDLINDFQNKFVDAVNQYNESKEKFDVLRALVKKLEEELSEQDRQKANLVKKVHRSSVKIEDIAKLNRELKQYQNGLEQKQESLQQDVQILEEKLRQLKVEKEKIESDKQKLKLEQDVIDIAKQRVELEKSSLEQQVHNLEKLLDNSKNQVKELEEIRERLRFEIEQVREVFHKVAVQQLEQADLKEKNVDEILTKLKGITDQVLKEVGSLPVRSDFEHAPPPMLDSWGGVGNYDTSSVVGFSQPSFQGTMMPFSVEMIPGYYTHVHHPHVHHPYNATYYHPQVQGDSNMGRGSDHRLQRSYSERGLRPNQPKDSTHLGYEKSRRRHQPRASNQSIGL